METSTPNQPSDQLSYPTDKLIGIIDAMPDAEQARQELLEAGFAPDAIRIEHHDMVRDSHHDRHVVLDEHHRNAGVRYAPQKPREAFPQLARLLHVHSIEHEQAVVYEWALGQGQSVIVVHAPEADARQRALGILEAHNAHSINFYGKWTVEGLAS